MKYCIMMGFGFHSRIDIYDGYVTVYRQRNAHNLFIHQIIEHCITIQCYICIVDAFTQMEYIDLCSCDICIEYLKKMKYLIQISSSDVLDFNMALDDDSFLYDLYEN